MKPPMSMLQWVTGLMPFGALHLALFLVIAAGPATPAVGQWCEPERGCEPFQPQGEPFWHEEFDVEGGDEGRIAVVVQTGLYALVEPSIIAYKNDLTLEGHDVVVITFNGDAAYLRTQLMEQLYDQPGSLTGAVLVGNLPYVCYEHVSWEGPEDAFLMDMDGTWTDGDQDGKYDDWLDPSGEVEIWVSRIKVDNLTDPDIGEPEDIVNTYFARNHALRWNVFRPTGLGLVYIDDKEPEEWDETYCDPTYEALSVAFGSVEQICDERTTSADYLDRIARTSLAYHYIHEMGH